MSNSPHNKQYQLIKIVIIIRKTIISLSRLNVIIAFASHYCGIVLFARGQHITLTRTCIPLTIRS